MPKSSRGVWLMLLFGISFSFSHVGQSNKITIGIWEVWYLGSYYISFATRLLMTLNSFFDICTVYFV